MALFLNEEEVAGLLPMDECIQALDRAFAHAGQGDTEVKPRSRMVMPNGMFHFLAAADSGAGVFGYKAYHSFSGGAKMMVTLYDYETGRLLACMEGGRLGQIRTGAASGLATTETMSCCPLANDSFARAISSRQKAGSIEGIPKHTAELMAEGSSGKLSVA